MKSLKRRASRESFCRASGFKTNKKDDHVGFMTSFPPMLSTMPNVHHIYNYGKGNQAVEKNEAKMTFITLLIKNKMWTDRMPVEWG